MWRKGIVLLVIGVAWPCFAKMELPPTLSSGPEFDQFAAQIRMLVPEVARGNKAIEAPGQRNGVTSLIEREQDLVRKLKSLPQYMALAEQRPPLQVFTFRLVQRIGETSDQAGSWLQFRDAYGLSRAPLRMRVDNLRSLLERWPKRSSVGFFSAWAGLLDHNQKRALKDPNVRSRWAKINPIIGSFSIETLRQQLNAEAFDLRPNWVWSDLMRLAEEIYKLEDQIIIAVQSLRPLDAPGDSAWLIDESWEEWLAPVNLSSKEMQTLRALRTRAVKRFWDLNTSDRGESVVRELVLRELPPYLAIYRGCVGHDCSTSNSWPYPYSPMERNWWIEDISGNHLGYVSGAITQVNDRPNLYIRDITGPEVRRGDISLILRAFYLARGSFGAETMTIMNRNFTSQNHFPTQVQELNDFGGDFMQTVSQVFSDRWVREQHLRPLQSGPYDDIDRHTAVRLMAPTESELLPVRIESWPSAEMSGAQNPQYLWGLLADAVRRRDGGMLANLHPEQQDWQQFVQLLLNENRILVADFYLALEAAFNQHNLPYSRNLVRKYEHVFMPGHLSAPDAFHDEKGRKQSVRYLQNLIWRLGGEETGYQIVRQNLAILENDPHWISAVQSIFERRGLEDVARLKGLWDAGYRFQYSRLSRHDYMWAFEVTLNPEAAEWALSHMDGDRISTEGATILARKLANEEESVPEAIGEWAAKKILGQSGLAAASEALTSEIVLSMESDDNPLITVPLAIAYLRDVPNNHHFYRQAVNLLRQNRENGQLTADLKRRIRGALSRVGGDEDCEDQLRPRSRR